MSRSKLCAALAVAMSVLFFGQAQAQPTTVAELGQATHIHGLAVDPADPSRLLLATHHGFFVATEDGAVRQVSEATHDFMGFTPHPADPATLFASGHPQAGGNLGFMVSEDGGRTWQQRAPGVRGPVDFHSMDASKADPDVIYGVYGDLQVSRDGGHTWEVGGPAPERLIAIAASAKDPDTVYAATETGLHISMDAGLSWHETRLTGAPVSLIEVDETGRMFAFAVGRGLMQSTEGSPKWEALGADFGDQILLHLAADPADPDRLYAATHTGAVLVSGDGGASWDPFGSNPPSGGEP